MTAGPRPVAASPLDGLELPTLDAWREAVQRDLRGASFDERLVAQTPEGIAVQPLYAATGSTPCAVPARPAGAWRSCQRCALGDPEATREALRAEAAAGDAVWIELGRDPRIDKARDLARILDGVDLARKAVFLDAGGNAPRVAPLLFEVAADRGVPAAALRGALGGDPLGALARDGALPGALAQHQSELAELAAWTAAQAPGVRAVLVATEPYADAGAHAVQQLACGLATGVEYLRGLTAAGLSVGASCDQLVFSFAVGRDLFMELAKLRAARLLWAQVAAACGAAPEQRAMLLCARTAARTKTRRDPWVNLLRGTAECFAAAVGGAELIAVSPFDEACGESDDFARRIARNTQLILRHESHLARVIDPAAGSFYVESLTRELAQRAWAAFQAIERAGGMGAALRDGAIARDLGAARDAARDAIRRGQVSITGVSAYPLLDEPRVARPPHAQRHDPRPAPDAASAAPLPRWREAADFEALRDDAEALAALRGRPLRVLLATLGAPKDFRARADFARSFVESGGIQAVEAGALGSVDDAARAFVAAQADGAVICASDERYPTLVPELARRLAQAGARAVVLAGHPPDALATAYREAGVTGLIHRGCDRIEALRALHRALGGAQ